MNLDRAIERANSVSGDKAAAKLYADTEFELAMGEPSPQQEQAGEHALAVLEQRFEGVKGRADDVVETGHVPNLSRKGWEGAGASGQGRRPTRRHVQRAHSQVRARRGRLGRIASRRFQQTGIPGGAETATQLAMRTLGGLVGLSLLYLLVSPRGSRAVELGSSGVLHGIGALVSPNVDPLRATATARAAAAPAPAGARGAIPATGAITANASQIAGEINAIASSIGARRKPNPPGRPAHGGTF